MIRPRFRARSLRSEEACPLMFSTTVLHPRSNCQHDNNFGEVGGFLFRRSPILFRALYGYWPDAPTMACDDCCGSGRLQAGKRCLACSGRGWLWMEPMMNTRAFLAPPRRTVPNSKTWRGGPFSIRERR